MLAHSSPWPRAPPRHTFPRGLAHGLCFLPWGHPQIPGRLIPGRLSARGSLSLPPQLLYTPVGGPGLPGWSLLSRLICLASTSISITILSISGFLPFSSLLPNPHPLSHSSPTGSLPLAPHLCTWSGICHCHGFLDDSLEAFRSPCLLGCVRHE